MKKCTFCKSMINTEEDKYVLLGTYNGTGKAKKEEKFYHFQCWIDYFNQQIMTRIQKGQDMAMGMVKKGLSNLNIKIQNG